MDHFLPYSLVFIVSFSVKFQMLGSLGVGFFVFYFGLFFSSFGIVTMSKSRKQVHCLFSCHNYYFPKETAVALAECCHVIRYRLRRTPEKSIFSCVEGKCMCSWNY